MKKFLIQLVSFTALIVIILLAALFFLPSNASNQSILGAVPDKHQLLSKAGSPKIILIGGSSVSFGFDSKLLADAYHMPVVNTALSRLVGLKFMCSDVKPYIGKGDIVVMAAEYHCYEDIHTDDFEGDEGLLAIVFNVFPDGKKELDFHQWINLLKYVPHYTTSKIIEVLLSLKKQKAFLNAKNDIFGRKSFNEYGDAYLHWNMPNETFVPEDVCKGNEKVNPDVISFLEEFDKYLSSKGAKMVVFPNPVQAATYNNQQYIIKKIDEQLSRSKLTVLASSIRYRMSNNYFFNHPVHLNKKGADLHTNMVIEDLSKVIPPAK